MDRDNVILLMEETSKHEFFACDMSTFSKVLLTFVQSSRSHLAILSKRKDTEFEWFRHSMFLDDPRRDDWQVTQILIYEDGSWGAKHGVLLN